MEYAPVACMRQSSRCCRSDSLGCLPRNFPLAAIIIYWNTAHLGEAVRPRKRVGLTVEPELLARIPLTGEYQWPKKLDGDLSVRFCPLPESTRTTVCSGLSPRVRGNHALNLYGNILFRSIPARAGEPRFWAMNPNAVEVYPRACGGTQSAYGTGRQRRGLSPRVRGNPR